MKKLNKQVTVIRLCIAALYIFASMILVGQCTAQEKEKTVVGKYLSENKYSLPCFFLAGAFDGQTETLIHHYDKFKKVFPNANDNYWDYSISWENKYSKPLVFQWTSDGYHTSRLGQKAFLFGGIVLSNSGKKKWYKYVIDATIKALVYNAGFQLTWNVIYK